MSKKQICLVLAAVTSVCCLICLVAAVRVGMGAVFGGGTVPTGLIMLTLITGLCAGVIWKGTRDMD